MKIFTLLATALTLSMHSHGQIQNLPSANPSQEYDNIHVKKLSSDSLTSSFVIWVKKNVKPHKHLTHTEQVYILEGSGVMTLGNKSFEIKVGDYITIPKNTAHAVDVTSKSPLKVLSIQSPMFNGKDRIFLE